MSEMSEWECGQRSGRSKRQTAGFFLDVNNIYVSSQNHDF